MKKAIYFFLVTITLFACTPTTNSENQSTEAVNDSDNNVDVPPSSGGDSISLNDIVESVDAVEGGVQEDPQGQEDKVDAPKENSGNTGRNGRMANPDIDLNAKTYTVSGHINIIGSYCGGAAPTPEVLKAAEKPQPYAKQSLLIRKGKTNVLGTSLATRTMTDANGDFSVMLPAGDYCLVLAEKENVRGENFSTTNMSIDQPCDDKWLKKCDINFTVTNTNVSGLRLNIQKACFLNTLSPCVTYTGPKPPAAAPRGK